MSLKLFIKRQIRNLIGRTPLRSALVHRYEYFFWPRELAFLCDQLEQCISLPGAMVEIGCARGATAVYLNKHLDCLERWEERTISKEYVCVDTFAGFLPEHVAHEQNERGWKTVAYEHFRLNDIGWFESMLKTNGVSRARAIKADAGTFDYKTLSSGICFAILDVDLYLPIIQALPKLYACLAPGGIIIVDDCQASQKYDGARQAYAEFVKSIGFPERYEHRKFGMIQKPL